MQIIIQLFNINYTKNSEERQRFIAVLKEDFFPSEIKD
jgi:hypothetical protein